MRYAVLALALFSIAAGQQQQQQQQQGESGKQGEQQSHQHHGTTVCIEIRPHGPNMSPTKVCGPVVQGQDQQAKAQQGSISQQQVQSDARANEGAPMGGLPCPPGAMRLAGMPIMGARTIGDWPHFIAPPMDIASPMGMEPVGFRQAGPPQPPQMPPCPFEQAAMRQAMGPMPFPRPPMPITAHGRTFYPTALARQAEGQPKSDEGQPKSADFPRDVQQEETKERLEHLLKECDEKTKQLKEKEKRIEDLLLQIEESKKKPTQQPQQQTANAKN